MKSPLLRLAVLLVALVSLASGSYAQGMGIDPDAAKRLTGLLDKYHNTNSYADSTEVMTSTPGPGANTSRHSSYRTFFAWNREHGLRLEGERDNKQFVVRSDGKQVRQHWLKNSGTDSTTPLAQSANFLSGTPFDLPGFSIISGTFSPERLNLAALSLAHNNLTYDPEGQGHKTDILMLDYTNDKAQHIKLSLSIGETDDVLYNVIQEVEDGANQYATVEVHHNIQSGASLPAQGWTLDFPLMGDSLKATAPPALTQTEVVQQLPIITATDVNGKPFTVSPDDKKATLFYFFTPGSARSYIDDVQQLQEEGEARSLRVVGIVTRGGKPENRTSSAVRAFVAEHHITFPVYVEENAAGLNALEHQLGNFASAQTLIYDAAGQLKSDATFFHTPELRAVVNSIAPLVRR